MPFEFSYEVKDPKTDNEQSHSSKSDGEVTEGSYKTKLPDGRTQVVTYKADKNTGFVAEVTYTGQVKPPSPGGASGGAPGGTPGGGSGGAPGGSYSPPPGGPRRLVARPFGSFTRRGRQLHSNKDNFDGFSNGVEVYGPPASDLTFGDASSYEISETIDRIVKEKTKKYSGKSLKNQPTKKLSNKKKQVHKSEKKQRKTSTGPSDDKMYHREIPEELINGRTFMVPFLQNFSHLQKQIEADETDVFSSNNS